MYQTARITRTFFIALAMAAVIVLADYALLSQFMKSQDHAAAMINDSGRQRMLSQRIAMWSERLVDAEDEAQRQQALEVLRQASETLLSTHLMLTDPSTHIGGVTYSDPRILAIYYEPPVELDEQVRRFLGEVNALMAAPAESLNPDNPHLQYILEQSSARLLEGFDRAVSAYQDGNARDLNLLHVTSLLLFCGALVVIGGLWWVVFRPMLESVSSAIKLTQLQQNVATAANEADSIQSGLQVGIDNICDYTGWPVGHVYIFSQEQQALVSLDVWHVRDAARTGSFKEVSQAMRFAPGQGFIGEVYADSTPMWILDVTDSSVYLRKDAAREAGLKAAFAFPIFVGRTAVAVMEFYASEAKIPREELLRVMANVGKQLGQVIERQWNNDAMKETLTQLKRANLKAEAAARDMQASLIKAEEASKAKSDFLANMSHELRTPMNGVLGMALLLADMDLSPEQRECVSTINSSGESLLMLLNDILDFSKIEAGALQLEYIPYEPKDVVHRTAQLLGTQAHKKHIDLLVDIDESIPKAVMGDPGRVRQILMNLLGNAIKFTEKGYVRLSARRLEQPEGDVLQIRVEDTGTGIPAEKLGNIFEKFTQADSSVTRKYGGTGLGLAITRQLVGLMGGSIGVESVLGKGSTFWITLPLTEANFCLIEAQKEKTEQRLAGRIRKPVGQARALLVEDYPVNQVFAQKLLKKFGFTQIDLAENGNDALLQYRTHPYDVIFMDCQMPEMDGYQATGKIRALEEGTPLHTPIVAMTANAMMGDREKCLSAGMDDYISKPLRAEHLRTILQGLFELEPAKAQLVPAVKVEVPVVAVAPVDLEQLRMFTDGDPEEERALINLFLEQAQQMIALLEQSVEDPGQEVWKSAAHRFKGSSGNLGAMKLHHLCKRAELHSSDAAEQKREMLAAIRQETQNVANFFAA